MDRRIKFLDDEGFAAQVIYPTMGILWQGDVQDPLLADALCRAYNTWAFEMCAAHKDRLIPAAHISLLDAALAAREIDRVAKLGCKTIFVASTPIDGHGFGIRIWIRFGLPRRNTTSQSASIWSGMATTSAVNGFADCDPGFMFITMNVIQDPRMALTTMVYEGVLERFPKLRVATIEAMSGWVGEWIERLDYRFKYMGHTSQMKRSASEYFARNIWISADPGRTDASTDGGFRGRRSLLRRLRLSACRGLRRIRWRPRAGGSPNSLTHRSTRCSTTTPRRSTEFDMATVEELIARVRRLDDIEQIKQLKARYCAYCDDNYDAEGIASLFTEDGVWDGGALGKGEGRAGIVKFFQRASSAFTFAIHNVMNPIIEVDGDNATGRWYLMQPLTRRSGDSESAMWLAGRYEDDYVRVDGEWKFQSLRFFTRMLTPYDEGWAKKPMG